MTAITPIVMPKWGLSMKEGTVNAWLVQEGDRIRVGDAILEVETDKITGAVEAGDPGILRRKVASPGQTLPVKALLGVMAEADVLDRDIDAFIAAYVVPIAAESSGEGEGESAHRFVDVDGIRVRYARHGGRGPTVLLIHGFGGDLDNWLFNIDALAEAGTVVALDLPGHGQSERRLPGTTLADLAGFVTHFMDTLRVEQAHLVGHSMGGAIAAQMACEHPGRVESVALVASAGLGDEINTGYTEGFVSAQSRRELKPIVEQLFADPDLVTRQLLDDLLRYKRLDGVTELLGALGGRLFAHGTQREQPGRRLPTGTRVLAVWGAEDRIIPAGHARNAPASARVAVLEGAGHMVQMEKPRQVNSLLQQHVAG
ncbi:MAG: acetoin dehydrogenase dihydrolipoyllysine-residue acetyltransferase subunit [Candidatus Rokuibacteriota bacterium]|nr:MAG: acetoin dehydrogenase dihydrolipoyllysine-residue acetyltransferase subunit [Candidatus Rokubacteria bacterium]